MENLSDYSNYVLTAYLITIIAMGSYGTLILYRYLSLKRKLRILKNEK